MGGAFANRRLAATLAAIDRENAADPRGQELEYGRRMSAQLAALEPAPSDALAIACRAQHIRRWAIGRTEYPEGRAGYRRWRAALGRLHGELAAGIAREAGYGEETAARIEALVRKQRLATDPEAQTLEDVACLVFLRHYLGPFAAKHPRAKVVEILQKTWKKMSPRGQAAALELVPAMEPELGELVTEALS